MSMDYFAIDEGASAASFKPHAFVTKHVIALRNSILAKTDLSADEIHDAQILSSLLEKWCRENARMDDRYQAHAEHWQHITHFLKRREHNTDNTDFYMSCTCFC